MKEIATGEEGQQKLKNCESVNLKTVLCFICSFIVQYIVLICPSTTHSDCLETEWPASQCAFSMQFLNYSGLSMHFHEFLNVFVSQFPSTFYAILNFVSMHFSISCYFLFLFIFLFVSPFHVFSQAGFLKLLSGLGREIQGHGTHRASVCCSLLQDAFLFYKKNRIEMFARIEISKM